MRTPNRPPIAEGIRARYSAFLVNNKRAYLLLKAFGISKRRAMRIAVQGNVPSLREALCIDCVTNGDCDVYGWVDTEWMEQRSNRDCESEANDLWRIWPRPVLQEYRAARRLHMVQRLGAPDRNALAVVAKLGVAQISKDARREQALKYLRLPVCVDEDATDEQIKRAVDRHERRRARALAYIKGKRSSVES